MKRSTSYLVFGAIGLALIVAAALLWWEQRSAPQAIALVPPPAPAVSAPLPIEGASAPGEQHPVEPPAESASAPTEVQPALADLFGRKALLSMFQVDNFPHRFVSTVDNLGRSQAPSRLWPVNPPTGHFGVDQAANGDTVVDSDNGLRYAPLVLLVENVDMRQLVATYKRLYPQFQKAYRDLGYPNGYFNDRLIQVIDLLLGTPQLDQPPKVHLPPIYGPLQPRQRPWAFYEFDDPALEALTSGQKMLLRMGPVNERRMKAKLAEFRHLITASRRGR